MELRDENLTRRAKELLEKDEQLSRLRIRVEVKEGVVCLRGRVGTEQQKKDAERLVEGVIGVKEVMNHLVVEGNGSR